MPEELTGMPAKDKLYQLAEELVEYKEQIKDINSLIENLKPQLIDEFRSSSRENINVRGVNVSFSEVEKITVKK